MMRLPASVVALLLLASSVPLDRAAVAAGCRKIPVAGLDDFDAPGPHPVGVRTATFVDTSRPTPAAGRFPGAPERTLVTEIWYPALEPGRDAAVAAAGGPYPVVVYSHGGGGGQRTEAEMIGTHLASRGFIVAAPDFPLSGLAGVLRAGLVAEIMNDVVNQPGDLSVVLDGVLADFGAAADPGRIGATGHSIGGLTTLLVTYHRDLRDPRIRASLPLAPAACIFSKRFYRTVDTPLLVMHGDSDQVSTFRENARAAYRGAQRPRFLVRLENGSHLGFGTNSLGFDPAVHYDRVACSFLAPLFVDLDPQDPFGFFASGLGGSDVGIVSHCSAPCSGAIPDEGAMPAPRHTRLTRVAEAAFFQAYLLGDDTARCFLRRTLKHEPDVKVKSRGAGRPLQ